MNESFDKTYSFNQQFSTPNPYEQFFFFLFYAIFSSAVHWYLYHKIRLSFWGRIIKKYVTLTLIGNALQFMKSPKNYLDGRVTKLVSAYNGPFKNWFIYHSNPDISTSKNPQAVATKHSCEFFTNLANDPILAAENKTNILTFARRSYESLTQVGSTHCPSSNFTEENNEDNCLTRGSPFNINASLLNCLETLNEQNIKLINRLKKDAGTEQEFDLCSHVRPTSIMKTCKTTIARINRMCENTFNMNPPLGPPLRLYHLPRKILSCCTVVNTWRRNIETQMPRIFRNRYEK